MPTSFLSTTRATRPGRSRCRPVLAVFVLFFTALAAGGLAAEEKLAKLEIVGADREQRNNIRAHIGDIQRSQLQNAWRVGRKVEQQALQALQALGYFEPQLSVEVNGNRVRLTVDSGPATIITSVALQLEGEGETHERLLSHAAALRALQGERFASATYEQRKSALRTSARRNGFLDAAYTHHRVVVDKRARAASVELRLDTGAAYSVGELRVSETPLRKARIDSLTRWQPGEPFHTDKLDALQRRLLDTGYFASAVLEQEADRDARRVDIDAKLVMNSANKIRTGIGFGTDTGPRAKITWDKPWLNHSGHSTRVEVSGSAVKQGFKALYKIPSVKRPDTHWQTEFDLVEEDIEDTRSSQQQLGLAYVTPLPKGWRGSFYGKYLREQFTQGNERGRSELLLPGASANLTKSRGGLIPSSGFRISGSVEGAHDGLFSDATLLRLTFDTRYIQSYRKHRLLTGMQLGSLFLPGHTNLQDIPSSLRFFAGGDQSIRGYDYKSVAPRDDSGQLIGGQYLAVAKVEYNYRFAKNWRAALFVDGGSAFNNSSDRFYLGPGFGVHWLSPIGAVRFDVGFAASEDQQLTLHLNVGPEL